MEETISGVKFRGKWKKLVRNARRVTETLQETAAPEEIEPWEAWRPAEEEDLDEEVKERTVEEASLAENEIEKEDKSVAERTEEAVKDAENAIKDVAKGNVEEASEESQRAIIEFFRSMRAAARKFVRSVERFIYHHIIARSNPHYFDSELVSASLKEKTRLQRKDPEEKEYVMAVTINDDRISERFRKKLREREER